MVRASDTTAIESLQKRFKTRVALGLSLARAYRFVAELEPSPGDGPDPFADLALPAEIKRAVIAHRGELTPSYRYLQRHLQTGEAAHGPSADNTDRIFGIGSV